MGQTWDWCRCLARHWVSKPRPEAGTAWTPNADSVRFFSPPNFSDFRWGLQDMHRGEAKKTVFQLSVFLRCTSDSMPALVLFWTRRDRLGDTTAGAVMPGCAGLVVWKK